MKKFIISCYIIHATAAILLLTSLATGISLQLNMWQALLFYVVAGMLWGWCFPAIFKIILKRVCCKTHDIYKKLYTDMRTKKSRGLYRVFYSSHVSDKEEASALNFPHIGFPFAADEHDDVELKNAKSYVRHTIVISIVGIFQALLFIILRS
ncbi:MAG: hypothetical protein FWG87_00960 [Defluviitaleaceae bacterium]|nr:hypothetical protein [Defluviitaleaceae bacterium]